MSHGVLAIDPGPEKSAWLLLDSPDNILSFGILSSEDMVEAIRRQPLQWDTVVIEKVEGYGMAVGAEVFETVYWSGQFAEAAHPTPVDRIGRKAIKVHLCGTVKAKDPNIRAALIDRYGGPAAIRKGGALYGVSKDVWSALALACTWADLHRGAV